MEWYEVLWLVAGALAWFIAMVWEWIDGPPLVHSIKRGQWWAIIILATLICFILPPLAWFFIILDARETGRWRR